MHKESVLWNSPGQTGAGCKPWRSERKVKDWQLVGGRDEAGTTGMELPL